MQNPAFAGFGRLIFPVDMRIDNALALKDVEEILPWYSEVNPERTISIVNEMKMRVKQGETIFYDIYTDEEKAKDPAKKDTGLFFFRGNPGEKFAITNAGGGFAYVAAMHDSFPHMQELAKRGYNAFALIYRPGAQTACEDLARAIAFIHEHKEELQVDTDGYSLWGGPHGRLAWVLWNRSVWRKEVSCTGSRDHAVHRIVGSDRDRAANLRLCGNPGRHRLLPDHAAENRMDPCKRHGGRD